jgi:VanZ family protein
MKLSAQALYRLGGWCLALLITALSLVPPDLRPESGTPHRFEHFAIFCATGAAFGLGYTSNRRLPLAIVLVIFAGAIEFAQIFAPGRHARISDFLVDAFAACIGVAVSALVTDFANAYSMRS